jgi:hypothetical protein
METLESMRLSLERKFKEGLDPEEALDAINEAIASLWRALVDANIGDYISQKPDNLVDDEDVLPFSEIASAPEFIRCYALSTIALSVDEFDQAAAYKSRADDKRSDIILEVLHASPRQTHVKRFDPNRSARNMRTL